MSQRAALSCSPLLLLLLLVVFVVGQVQAESGAADSLQYRIAAFNVQVFGRTKFGKADVVDVLKQIICRYDIILIQEIRDSSNTAFPGLIDDISDSYPYTVYNISEQLGRSSYKEQYAFIYNSERLSSVATYQYPDDQDWFERPPYCVHYTLMGGGSGLSTFGVCGIHVKPADAVAEINHLPTVYDQVASQFGTQDIILMGDFNADCNYVGPDDWDSISLWTNSTFTWLIDHAADTTVKSTDCAYDRLVVTGQSLIDAVGACPNAEPFLFDDAYDLSNDAADDVSDHYPVEMNIYRQVPVYAQPTVTLHSQQGPAVDIITLTSSTTQIGAFSVTNDDSFIWLTASVGCGSLVSTVKALTDQYPGALAEVVVCEVGKYADFFTLPYAVTQCTVKIEYEKTQPNYYSVSLSGIYP